MSRFRLVAAVCFAISSLIAWPNDTLAGSDAPMQVRLSGGLSFSALEYTQALDDRAVYRTRQGQRSYYFACRVLVRDTGHWGLEAGVDGDRRQGAVHYLGTNLRNRTEEWIVDYVTLSALARYQHPGKPPYLKMGLGLGWLSDGVRKLDGRKDHRDFRDYDVLAVGGVGADFILGGRTFFLETEGSVGLLSVLETSQSRLSTRALRFSLGVALEPPIP